MVVYPPLFGPGFHPMSVAALRSLVDAGIPIFKLQEAAALWVKDLTLELVPQLRVFTDTIYLSQTTMRRGLNGWRDSRPNESRSSMSRPMRLAPC